MTDKLFEVISKGSLDDLVEYLKYYELDISEATDSSGFTALHTCVSYGKSEHIRALLHLGQNFEKPIYNNWINRQTKDGYSPLLLAVSKGNFPCVQVLVQFNADIYATNNLGLGVIHLCAQGNHPQILAFFYEMRMDLQNCDNKGGTPLHWAAYMGSFNSLSLLLSLGVNKNTKDNEGRTALHLAVVAANEKVVRKLIVYGASTEVRDKKNRTPLEIAIGSDSKGIVKMLKDPAFFEKISCKTKLQKPNRNNKHLVTLICFITFSFIFILFFCAKGKKYLEGSIGSFMLIGIVAAVIANLIYLMSSNPGYIEIPKTYNWQELYKNAKGEICTDCKIFRPPRSRHCFYCNRCVMRYDHHCQWINNCVGLKNNNMFLIFLFTLIILCGVVDYIAVDVFLFPKDDGMFRGKNSIPPAAIVVFISSLILYPITLLFIIQVKNFSHNKTSSERLSKNRKHAGKRGFFLTNCYRMCCNKPN